MNDATRRCLAGVVLAVACICSVCAQAQPHENTAQAMQQLKPEHPRVLATAEDFARIAELVKTDPRAKRWHRALEEDAEQILNKPVVRYSMPDGRRLLMVSRRVADHALTLALLDQISPDDRYRDRLWQELEAAAAFPDWNPAHFLDVAEMAFAFGIAYDWMYDRWTTAQRRTIREAMLRHAFEPALADYATNAWWTRTRINWNQVCNGGLIVAALAIADERPDIAGGIVRNAVKALPISMKRYAPDGGYEEGPGYWGYGTIYNVFAVAALESALGTDLGLGDTPGFDRTANFPQHMTGATGRQFNFGDNKEGPVYSPAMLYLSKRFNQPGNAYYAAQHAKGSPLDLLWYDPAVIEGKKTTLPDNVVYKSAGVAAIRSGWHDKNDWYLAAKGGWMGFGHAQMDLGTFILERKGVRWFIDLGSDDYNLPGYFSTFENGARWKYYRNRAEGHNTLVINPDQGGGQDFNAKAAIECKDQRITIDLSQAYGGKVTRQIGRLLKSDAALITDTLSLKKPSEVWWFAHTRARVTVSDDGRSALLRQDGHTMRVTIDSPKGAAFKVMPAEPLDSSPDPAGQDPNNGASIVNPATGSSRVRRGEIPKFGEPDPSRAVRKLAIHLRGVTDTRIEVRCEMLAH